MRYEAKAYWDTLRRQQIDRIGNVQVKEVWEEQRLIVGTPGDVEERDCGACGVRGAR
jgi:hypothetical protein